MPDALVDGNTRVAFVASIANPAAPTTTELNAGILLHPVMTTDGLVNFSVQTATVDGSGMGSVFDGQRIGRDSMSGDPALRLKKQIGTDTAHATLTRGTSGFVVVRRDIDRDTAWASAQGLEVYPGECGRRMLHPPEGNAVRKYEVPWKVSSDPYLDATVA